MQSRLLTSLQIITVFELVTFCGTLAIAHEPVTSEETPAVPLRCFTSGGWQVAATDNFRMHHRGELSRVDLQRLARHLEVKRSATGSKWLGSDFASTWSVECDVFLHSSDVQYEQHSRMPAETIGYARLKVGRGKVWSRRLDLRWQSDPVQTFEVASHELTHIVLADRFCWYQIPRWADEGIAIASEEGVRPERLAGVLREAVQTGRLFSLQELLAARVYPQDRQMADLFYAQSASLVRYLAETYGHEQVIELADSASRHGMKSTIAEISTLRSTAELEQVWMEWLARTAERQATLIALDD